MWGGNITILVIVRARALYNILLPNGFLIGTMSCFSSTP